MPLAPQAVRRVFYEQTQRSGLNLSARGTHCLRHSFALRLLQQGVPVKTIGDALGHGDPGSTGTYLRLAIEDLREVCAPVPKNGTVLALLTADWEEEVPRLHLRKGPTPRPPSRFRSYDRDEMQRYLETKKALGRKYTNEARTLLDWDAFLFEEGRQSSSIDGELFARWSTRLEHLCPRVRRYRMESVRNFLRFHARDHTVRFIPDLTTFPRLSPPKLPRLISESEMALILATATRLPPSRDNPLRAETLRIGLLLLFCCGLRRGELLRLRLRHVDLTQNLVHIEDTKFHKSRLVPFSPELRKELSDYLELRRQRRLAVDQDSYLIIRRASPKPQKGMGLLTNWRRLCQSVKVLNEQGRPPRLHDLRHSAAVNAVQRWYAHGDNVQAKLPLLAAYLGHVNLAGTHYYLHLTPKLREAASERSHKQAASIFHSGGEA
jgi:integrase